MEKNTRNLLKLNAKNLSSCWKITSSSRNLAPSMPFVALTGRKLYVDVCTDYRGGARRKNREKSKLPEENEA
ncbi:hypothetical protein H5410_063361 [Solanum commersonii]|uniref:Uncharacterized protein n=1 Tax=Solanum commersonii TaxID=4109 RepID=A0A9J5WD10_SOLCO|nr:hypothetical protein H5410_063361 [Solanum commersonii]